MLRWNTIVFVIQRSLSLTGASLLPRIFPLGDPGLWAAQQEICSSCSLPTQGCKVQREMFVFLANTTHSHLEGGTRKEKRALWFAASSNVENVPSNERQRETETFSPRQKAGRQLLAADRKCLFARWLWSCCDADLCAEFRPLRCCRILWQLRTDTLPECAHTWCNDAFNARGQARVPLFQWGLFDSLS